MATNQLCLKSEQSKEYTKINDEDEKRRLNYILEMHVHSQLALQMHGRSSDCCI